MKDTQTAKRRPKVRLVSREQTGVATSKAVYQVENVDISTLEGYWMAVNAIRERLYNGHA
jgi:hypothetical protein